MHDCTLCTYVQCVCMLHTEIAGVTYTVLLYLSYLPLSSSVSMPTALHVRSMLVSARHNVDSRRHAAQKGAGLVTVL